METNPRQFIANLKVGRVLRHEKDQVHSAFFLVGHCYSQQQTILIDAIPLSEKGDLLSQSLPGGLSIIGTFSQGNELPKAANEPEFPIVSLPMENQIEVRAKDGSSVQAQLSFLKTPEEEKQFFKNVMTLMFSVAVPFGQSLPSMLQFIREKSQQKGSLVLKMAYKENQKWAVWGDFDWSSVRKEWLREEGEKPLNERVPLVISLSSKPSEIKSSSVVVLDQDIVQCIYEDALLVSASCRDSEIAQMLMERVEQNINKKSNYKIRLMHQNRFVFFPFLVGYELAQKKEETPFLLAFDIPQDRPLIRIQDSVSAKLSSSKEHTGKLKDVHLDLVKKAEPGSESHLVSGSYIYFHYLQDGLHDDGWGCAYRSLQTLISWFIENNYVSGDSLKIPSHIEIQRTLVKLGDKPASFIGSSEWIGSFEVSLVLQSLCGVDSTLLHVERGSLVPSKTSSFVDHFTKQGTPIMIGGGVLAYTMLGIMVREDGSPMYLILDPHYKGADVLKNVTSKKGVFWKDSSLFRADSFYNFCCPIRPKVF